MELTLCYRCKNDFIEAGEDVRRKDMAQETKDTCDLCRTGRGYEYIIREDNRNEDAQIKGIKGNTRSTIHK